MCILTAKYRNIEINFLLENVFKEKDQILVKNPIISDDTISNKIPKKIRLADLKMNRAQKEKMLKVFSKKKKEKEKAKTRKQRKAIR